MPIDDIDSNKTEFKYDPGTVLETIEFPKTRFLVSQVGTTELEGKVQPAYNLVDLTPNWQSDDKAINFSHATSPLQKYIVENPHNFVEVAFLNFFRDGWPLLGEGSMSEFHQIRKHYNGPGFRYLH